MFVHGREAYRRNAQLISYTFYKNVLYVITQYYFGFVSAFSGQPLYEPIIYQFYNITMTSLPIMYYALFDFEYEKDYQPTLSVAQRKPPTEYLMRNPYLYRIGMESSLYGTKEFILWLLYAMFHALVIYYVNLYALTHVGAYLGGSE
jgi:magnesium-transporting ATPase (P-type)